MKKKYGGPLSEPDLSFLNDLRKKRSKFNRYEEENGHITRMNIPFSPRTIPPSVVNLKHLKEITTGAYESFRGYGEEESGYPLMMNSFPFKKIKPVPEYLRPFLQPDQIRGWELWESELEALKKLGFKLEDEFFLWNAREFAREYGGEDLIDDELMIDNGHVKCLRISVHSNEELDSLKQHILKFKGLEEIDIGGVEFFPDWLKNLLEKNFSNRQCPV